MRTSETGGGRDMGDTGAGQDATLAPPGAPAETPAMRRSYEDLAYELAGISPRRRALSAMLTHRVTASAEWLQDHWLGVVNGFLGTYVGVAVLTPVAYMAGWDGPASAVFRTYRIFCDELPTHSLFIGGYQMCLCARCLAIYTTMLAVGLTLAVVRTRRHAHGIPWWAWVLAALPMALDGFTQLFGLRESNLALRLLTGCLFGLGTALFVLPQLDAASHMGAAPASARRRVRRA